MLFVDIVRYVLDLLLFLKIKTKQSEEFMKNYSRVIGGIGIIAGTTIGASMIALPIASSRLGFCSSVALMLCVWLLMFFSALVIMKLALHFDETHSIVGIADKVLGKPAKIITFASMVLLFYSLLAAYVAGASDILTNRFFDGSHVAKNIVSVAVVLILGFLVYRSTKLMDYGNRVMMFLKAFCFVAMLMMTAPYISAHYLLQGGVRSLINTTDISLYAIAIPIFFTSFGFHGSIITIVKYLKRDKNAIFTSISLGSFIPVLIYIAWLVVTIGVLPNYGTYSFENVILSGGNVGVFIAQLGSYINMQIFEEFISYFAVFAILTSFLGVAAGFFDVFLEMMSKKNAIFCTLIPPLFVSIIIPQAFMTALAFASIALCIIAIIIPSIAMIKLEQKKDKPLYMLSLYFSLFFGISIIAIAIIDFIFIL